MLVLKKISAYKNLIHNDMSFIVLKNASKLLKYFFIEYIIIHNTIFVWYFGNKISYIQFD